MSGDVRCMIYTSGPQHQSSGEDQIVGVQDRGGTAECKGDGRWDVVAW